MNVDDPIFIMRDKGGSENAHVFCKHKELRFVSSEDRQNLGFVLLPRQAFAGDRMEWKAEFRDQGFEMRVIADYRE